MPEPVDAAVAAPSPLSTLTDDERLFRDSVREFAGDRVAPLVRAMDEQQALDRDLLQALFELGVMGIEVPEMHGGAGGRRRLRRGRLTRGRRRRWRLGRRCL